MSAARDAVVGAGIVGIALAYALARRGRQVFVFDATPTPQGASVRNFGTLWPIGQPAGPRRTLALESLAIWRDVLTHSGTWFADSGSLHLAYHDDEFALLEECALSTNSDGFTCRLLDPAETRARVPQIRHDGLVGALASEHEMQVNSRTALVRLPQWLAEQYGVRFERGARITACGEEFVQAGARRWDVDRVWLATGDDLSTLYPETFAELGLRRCKLQMMRTSPVPWLLGAILAAGLTLGHYDGFASYPGLDVLKARLRRDWPSQVAHGIHVLVAQHESGHLILGDSHEYDDDITPFDKPSIDDLVLTYLRSFLDVDPFTIIERWHGTYVKHPRDPYCVCSPEPGVTVVAALGGHGMTLSFGLAEQVVRASVDR